MDKKVWLITGASSGFGRAIAEAAIAAGDTVVGAARRTKALDDLVAEHPDQFAAVELDVTDPVRVDAVANLVTHRYGRIDVLVNNAGRSQIGAVEETTDSELRDLMEVHLFGPAALIRAVLPQMRSQRSGTIVQMSSMGGQLSFAGFGAYSATKCALEGMSEALAAEVAPFGIKVLIVEPGAFRTGLFGPALYRSDPLPGYEETVGPTRDMASGADGNQPGDPARAAAAILRAIGSDDPPLRLPLGPDAADAISAHLDSIRSELTAWDTVIRDTGFDA